MPSLASSNNSNPLSLLNDSTSFLRRCGFTLTFNYITHQPPTIWLGFVTCILPFDHSLSRVVFCVHSPVHPRETNKKKLNWTITPYLRFMDGICAPCVKVVIVCERKKEKKERGEMLDLLLKLLIDNGAEVGAKTAACHLDGMKTWKTLSHSVCVRGERYTR